ncbi:MAG: hypothetical protein ABH863_02280 [Candidatus Micrarchaeota archaeon]
MKRQSTRDIEAIAVLAHSIGARIVRAQKTGKHPEIARILGLPEVKSTLPRPVLLPLQNFLKNVRRIGEPSDEKSAIFKWKLARNARNVNRGHEGAIKTMERSFGTTNITAMRVGGLIHIKIDGKTHKLNIQSALEEANRAFYPDMADIIRFLGAGLAFPKKP